MSDNLKEEKVFRVSKEEWKKIQDNWRYRNETPEEKKHKNKGFWDAIEKIANEIEGDK